MKKIHIILGAATLLAVGLYLLYSHYIPSMSVNYKLTVTLDTPDGLVEGSTVRNVSDWDTDFDDSFGWGFPESTRTADVSGEAVVVDLGEPGVLFGLIDSGSKWELYNAFRYRGGASSPGGIRYYRSIPVGSKANLPREYWPMMVTFTDMNDPKTVTRVTDDNIESVLGTGVKIQSVTVEITDEDVTEGDIEPYITHNGNKHYFMGAKLHEK